MSKRTHLELFDLDDWSRKRIKIEDFETTKEQEEEAENSEIPLDFNPWNVTNFNAFLVYDCPECQHKSHDCVTFAKHAAMRHYHKAHDFLQRMIRAGIVNLNLPPLRSEPTNSHQSEPKPIEDTVQPIVVTSENTNTDDPLIGSETEFLSDPLADVQEENFESDETLTQCHSSVKLEQVEETSIDSDETLTQCHSSVMLKEDPEVNESLAPLELEQVPNPIEQYIPKKALSGREMFAILTSPDIQDSVVRSIPCGFKQDVHFVTHNFNKGRYEINQPFNHPSDDIGAVKSSTKKYLYRFVPEDMDVQFVNKLHKYKGPPLSPDVKVIMKVVNSFKQTNKNYKRNIAYIVEAPALVKQAMDYCLVEYLGYDAEGGCSKEVHKNRKHGNVPYHKNDPQIMEGCKNDVRKNLSNKEVFNKWFDPSDPVMSIRSSRQISDMKRKTKKTHSKRSF